MTTPADTLHTVFQASVASKGPQTRKAYLTSLQRLAAWAQSEGTDTNDLQTATLERFLAEEARQYARGTLEVRLAALRAFYQYLHSSGLATTTQRTASARYRPTLASPTGRSPTSPNTTSSSSERTPSGSGRSTASRSAYSTRHRSAF
jgi:hypothetical protein